MGDPGQRLGQSSDYAPKTSARKEVLGQAGVGQGGGDRDLSQLGPELRWGWEGGCPHTESLDLLDF